MKVQLDKAYEYNGAVYGPGEADVPDDITKEELTPAFRAAIEGETPVAAPAKAKLKDLDSVDAALAAELMGAGYENVEDLEGAKDAAVVKAVPALDKDRLSEIRGEISANKEG